MTHCTYKCRHIHSPIRLPSVYIISSRHKKRGRTFQHTLSTYIKHYRFRIKLSMNLSFTCT
nr:MAG TPA: hypothetical protein [Caudoviricetes sp.]